MAYIYNEKTGEFTQTPDTENGRKPASAPARPSPRPSQPVSSRSSSASSSDGSSLSGCLLGGLGYLLMQAIPYLLIGALCAMCS